MGSTFELAVGGIMVHDFYERNVWGIYYKHGLVCVQKWSSMWWVKWRVGRMVHKQDSGQYEKTVSECKRKEDEKDLQKKIYMNILKDTLIAAKKNDGS